MISWSKWQAQDPLAFNMLVVICSVVGLLGGILLTLLVFSIKAIG
jgi:hypothetical protein